MHALKSNEKASPPSAAGGEYAGNGSAILTLDSLGIREISQWKSAAHSQNGIILTAGATGSGKTTVLAATAKYLHEQGRQVITRDTYTAAVSVGAVVLYGEIRDPEMAKEMFDIADRGCLVLASIHAGSVGAALNRLLDLSIAIHRLGMIRGIISQYLLRKLAVDGTGYRGQTLTSDVRVFASRGDISNFMSTLPQYTPEFAPPGLVNDLVQKVRLGEVDLAEIERKFGLNFRKMVEVRSFKLIFAGSNMAAMRRLADKVFENVQVDPSTRVDMSTDDKETAVLAAALAEKAGRGS